MELWKNFDRLVVFDTETTGIEFGRDEIIELGAAAFSAEGETDCMDLLLRLSPGRTLPPFITQLTGITEEQLEQEGVEVTFLRADARGCIDYADLPRALRPNTRAIVCTHASNLTGNALDASRIGAFAREHGLLFILDASQTAGSFDLNAQRDGVCALRNCGKSRVRVAAQHALTQLGAVKLRKLRLGRRLGLVDDDVGAIVGSIRRPARAVGRGGVGRLLGLLPRQVKADAAVGAVHRVALQDQKTDRREQDQAQQNDQNDPSRTAPAVVAAVSLCRWHPSHLPFKLYGHFTSMEKENQQKFVNSC